VISVNRRALGGLLFLGAIVLGGCEGLLVTDAKSMLVPRFTSAGMNPTMAAIMGAFQVLWIYYGLLIVSRPVVL
jgi:hypothetical protein